MSFQVQVSGHSTDPHNEVIKAAAIAFANSLKESLGELATVTLTGYSGDSSGYISFGDGDRYPPAPVVETAAEPEPQASEPAPSESPSEAGTEPAPAEPTAPEAPAAPGDGA
jgi:hypothetical protein